MGKRKKSPCTNVCDFSNAKGWCRGCGRTREETRQWTTLKPYKRTALEKELERRKAKL